MTNGASDVETFLDNSERRPGNRWSYHTDYHNSFTIQVVFPSKKTAETLAK